MNGKTAKRLRRIARELHLNPTTTYAPMGPLRRGPEKVIVRDGKIETIPGMPIRRPYATGECERRAIQEAKKIYKRQDPEATEMPGQEFLREEIPFHLRHVNSMKRQPDGPVSGGSDE